mmetsp:Transcript_122775/g.393246  ORF Transcript_122775/g.393246 Transcript_122775/m.393246 type:complete len:132 (-) Transcript_122775:429-824(-)
MAMRIAPMKVSDGTGRDTYIHLDDSFKKGEWRGPVRWDPAMREHVPKGTEQHSKGYLKWFPRGKRPRQFAPPCQAHPDSRAEKTLRKPRKPIGTAWEERLLAAGPPPGAGYDTRLAGAGIGSWRNCSWTLT